MSPLDGSVFRVAFAQFSNLAVMGWSGPCPVGDTCPNIDWQSSLDVKINAYRANRARRLSAE